ncbi:MAG TPA: hypothetical protein VE817_02275, partial [Candidatus Acidoferrum sp.]|nr:hypothetical protein [Candidatus Acidoferrum sp.]
MFGSQARIRRPILLILVYGAFLALVGITATAQSALVSAHFSASALNDVVGSDAATTRAFVNAYVDPRFLGEGGPNAAELTRLDEQLGTLIRPGEIVLVELRRPDGSIVAASDAAVVGTNAPLTPDLTAAAGGSARAAMIDAAAAETGLAAPATLGAPTLLREYLPVSTNGKVRGIVAIWRDAAPILARL